MAVSMAATLALPGNIIAGQKFTATLTLTESGGTNTNLVSIQPFMLTSDGSKVASNARFGTVANSLTVANYTGAAVTLLASTSSTFNFDCVVDEPAVWGGGAMATANGTYLLGVNVQTSDGSVFGPQPMLVRCSIPSTGPSTSSPSPNGALNQSFILGTSTNQYSNVTAAGALRFDLPLNSNLIF